MMGEEPCLLMQLSDCVMLQILSYLDATSLYFLSQTCVYFENIIKDRKLWKFVNARSKPNTGEKITYCLEQIHGDTTHLLLKKDSKKGHLLFFDEISKILNCKNLTVLSLENQRFCGKKVSLKDFPPKLEELSLRKTIVRNGKPFFQHSSSSLTNLRVLVLDECNWLDSSFIMSVSKFPNLEIISIVKCNKLHYYIVPYLSVARHGCKKLKVLDCRFSTAGNDILRTFNENENILALYFQSMRSYQQDYDKPLIKNTEKVQNLTSDDIDLISQSIIDNRSLYNYKFAHGIDCNIEELPESLLYEDPYPSCTCKYQEHTENPDKEQHNLEIHLSPLTWKLTKKVFGKELYKTLCDHTGRTDPAEDSSNKHLMKVDDFMNFRSAAPQKFLCKRHTNEVENLPKEFKDFFVSNQLMFHAGQTDSDSGSDSDFDSDDCCMYGMGKAQRLILLRMNDMDSEGNLPQPEVFDFDADDSMEVKVIHIDPFGTSRNEADVGRHRRHLHDEIEYQMEFPDGTIDDAPSTSKKTSTQSSTTTDTSTPSTSRDTGESGEASAVNTPSTSRNILIESSTPSTSKMVSSSTIIEASMPNTSPIVSTSTIVEASMSSTSSTVSSSTMIGFSMPSSSKTVSRSTIIEAMPSTSRNDTVVQDANSPKITIIKVPSTSTTGSSGTINEASMPSTSKTVSSSTIIEDMPSTSQNDTVVQNTNSPKITIRRNVPSTSTTVSSGTIIEASMPSTSKTVSSSTIIQAVHSTSKNDTVVQNTNSPKITIRRKVPTTNSSTLIHAMPSTSKNDTVVRNTNSPKITIRRNMPLSSTIIDAGMPSTSSGCDHENSKKEENMAECSGIDTQSGSLNLIRESVERDNVEGIHISIFQNESEANIADSSSENDSNDAKGNKRSINSADWFCEPSTSRAESPLKKKRKQEKDNGNVTSSHDKVEGGNDSSRNHDNIGALLPDPTLSFERIPTNNEAVADVIPDQHNDYDSDDSTEPFYHRLQMQDLFMRPAVGAPEEHNKKKKIKLRRLSLRGYRKVTDSALNYIRNLKIDLLDLTHTSVTKRGIEQFLSYNPNCRVIHKDFCVCKPRIPS